MMSWRSFLEMVKLTKPEGFIYINAPSNDLSMLTPLDCWRFYPDAGKSLEKYASYKSDVILIERALFLKKGEDGWEDFVAVFAKSEARKHGLLSEYLPNSSYIFTIGK
jgi:hypothetical protein